MAPSEFIITLAREREEESGRVWTLLRFATVRQFRSFRYDVLLDESIDEASRTITVRLGGVAAPTNLMPETGPARGELRFPDLEGEYEVVLKGARQKGGFSFRIGSSGVTLVGEPSEGLEVRIDESVGTIAAA